MSSKERAAAKPRHKPTPYAKLLVADEFRIEQSGKVLAVGLYSDGVVVFTIPKNAPPPTKDTPYGIDGLALLLTVGGFVGETVVKFGLEGGKTLEHKVSLQPGNSANLILNLKPFRVGTFGVKKLNIEMAGTEHTLEFEVRANFIEPVENLDEYIELSPERAKFSSLNMPREQPVAKRVPAKKRPK